MEKININTMSNQRDGVIPRSSAWRPLNGSQMKNPEWVNNVLIPQLNEATGLTWIPSGDLLISSRCLLISRMSSNDMRKSNIVLQEIFRLYPCLTNESFGYKYEKWIKGTLYEGFWALNIDNIHNRGVIYGKEFGI